MDTSLKPIRIGIGIPTPDRVHPDFAIHCLTSIISYTRTNLPHVKIDIRYETGVRTDRNRNIILTDFIDAKCDYVLWLDSDMIFPADIIERFLEINTLHPNPAIIGCLYFKRTPDYNPIGYIDSDNPQQPYRPVMPQMIKKGKIYEVTGLGYGGMLVPMAIYDALGEDKWTAYGKNFNNPHATDGNLTHDLEFCRTVKKAGFKIFLHGSVRPGHIGEMLVTEQDFFNKFPPKLIPGLSVRVLMPTTDIEQATKAAKVLQHRAGYDCTVEILHDKDRKGFIATANDAFDKCTDVFVVYLAQDVFAGKDWLANALLEQFKTQAGLVAFNDGKWGGKLASFGLVERNWVLQHQKTLFCPHYHSHYADTELTQMAKRDDSYAYAKDAILLEIDYDKAVGKGKGFNLKDKKLYKRRIKSYPPHLAQEFS